MKKSIIKKAVSLALGISMLATGFCLPNSNVFNNNNITVSAASCHHNSVTTTYGSWGTDYDAYLGIFILMARAEKRTITSTCNRCKKVTSTRTEHRTVWAWEDEWTA